MPRYKHPDQPLPGVTDLAQQLSVVRRRVTACLAQPMVINHLRRLARDAPESEGQCLRKADASDMDELIGMNAAVMVAGDEPIRDGRLHAAAWAREHARRCNCMAAPVQGASPPGAPAHGCQFRTLLRAITHGIKLVPKSVAHEHDRPVRVYVSNHASYRPFAGVHDQSRRDLLAAGMLEPASRDPDSEYYVRAVAPSLNVLRGSDVRKAQAASGIAVGDERSLKAFEEWRAATLRARRAEGLPETGDPPKMKTRIAVNLTINGVNDYSEGVHMMSTTLRDAVALMYRGCWFAVIDLKDAYFHYPIATASRELLGIVLDDGTILRHNSLPFGLRNAPAWACAFIAEVMRMIAARGIDGMAYIDDILLVAASEAELHDKLATVLALLKDLGLEANLTKLQTGQVVIYLGVRLDGRDATVTACPTKAAQTRMDLQEAWDKRALCTTVPAVHELWRSLLGRLQWFSGLLQSGGCYTQAFWDLVTGRRHVSAAALEREYAYWCRQLEAAAAQRVITSSASLLSRDVVQHASIVLMSDAGDHGFGYVYCPLVESHEATTCSVSWTGWGTKPPSSTGKELCAPLHFLRTQRDLVRGKVVVCVTDSACLAANVLTGVSHGRHREQLEELMETADELECHLLAYWVPRELNAACDAIATHAHLLHCPIAYNRIDLTASGDDSPPGPGHHARSIGDRVPGSDGGDASPDSGGGRGARRSSGPPHAGGSELRSQHGQPASLRREPVCRDVRDERHPAPIPGHRPDSDGIHLAGLARCGRPRHDAGRGLLQDTAVNAESSSARRRPMELDGRGRAPRAARHRDVRAGDGSHRSLAGGADDARASLADRGHLPLHGSRSRVHGRLHDARGHLGAVKRGGTRRPPLGRPREAQRRVLEADIAIHQDKSRGGGDSRARPAAVGPHLPSDQPLAVAQRMGRRVHAVVRRRRAAASRSGSASFPPLRPADAQDDVGDQYYHRAAHVTDPGATYRGKGASSGGRDLLRAQPAQRRCDGVSPRRSAAGSDQEAWSLAIRRRRPVRGAVRARGGKHDHGADGTVAGTRLGAGGPIRRRRKPPEYRARNEEEAALISAGWERVSAGRGYRRRE